MNKKITKYLFLSTLVIFTTLVCLSLFFHSNVVVGVPLISKSDLKQYRYDQSMEATLLLNGVVAPVDENTNTIYISQNIKETTTFQDLQGTLSVKENDLSIKILEDKNYDNLYEAMSNNYKFKLVVLSSSDTYTTYDIIFTSLPVITLNSEFIGLDEENRASYSGEISVFNSIANQGNGYKVDTSYVDYHVRGKTSALYDKKPYKLTLKNSKGENKDLSLLGLGSDDDWILNPMNLDDVKVREKVAMDLWEEISQDNQNDMKMSTAEYVEVVQNGAYQGVYLLQRRLDKKYLSLNTDNILLKSTELRSMYKNLEVVYTSLEDVVINEYINSEFKYDIYVQHINISNYVDINILTQIGAMYDNAYKNRYFLIDSENTTKLQILLWDTDMSFGLFYDNGFVYRLEDSICAIVNQHEHDLLSQFHPYLDSLCAKRYFELRKSALTNENIHQIADKYYSQLTTSSSLIRDVEVYGVRYKNQDTIDNFHRFIDERLQYLDNYYRNWNS